MKYALIAVLLGVAACGPDEFETDTVELTFSGVVRERPPEEGIPSAGISGIRVSFLELDSLRAAGHSLTVTTDTTLANGAFFLRVRLDRRGSACTAQHIPYLVTLRFTDPRGRYHQTLRPENLCRYTPEALNAATALDVFMTPISP